MCARHGLREETVRTWPPLPPDRGKYKTGSTNGRDENTLFFLYRFSLLCPVFYSESQGMVRSADGYSCSHKYHTDHSHPPTTLLSLSHPSVHHTHSLTFPPLLFFLLPERKDQVWASSKGNSNLGWLTLEIQSYAH